MKKFLIFLIFNFFPFGVLAQEITVFPEAVENISKAKQGKTLRMPQTNRPERKKEPVQKPLCVLKADNPEITAECGKTLEGIAAIEVVYGIKKEDDTPQKKRILMQVLDRLKADIVQKTEVPEEKIWGHILSEENREFLHIYEAKESQSGWQRAE